MKASEIFEVARAAGFEIMVWAYPLNHSYMEGYYVTCEQSSDTGDQIKIKVTAPTLDEVLAETYTRLRRITSALPEFDANRTIAHSPAVADDEIPY